MSSAKEARRAPVPVEDFEPFYLKDSLLWVPYRSNGKLWIHTLTPAMAFKGIGFALKVLGGSGKVLPFTKATLHRQGG